VDPEWRAFFDRWLQPKAQALALVREASR